MGINNKVVIKEKTFPLYHIPLYPIPEQFLNNF